jgi:hypothetical protein
MTRRRRFTVIALAGLFASLLFAGGSARAAVIMSFAGQYSIPVTVNGVMQNQGISTLPSSYQAGDGTQQVFYLSGGIVSGTVSSSSFMGQAISDLTVDVSQFTFSNEVGNVTNANADMSSLLRVGAGNTQADFTIATNPNGNSTITPANGDPSTNEWLINVPVTLQGTTSGDDLTAFNTSGGGAFILDITNLAIQVPNQIDGTVFFPVDPTKPVTVSFSLVPTPPVPEPSSAVSLLTGAGLLGLWLRRRAKAL